MTRVLRYEEAILLETYPKDIDPAEELRGQLYELHEKEVILGGLIYGSTTFSGHNPASDIDLLVAVDDRNNATTQALRKLTASVHRQSGIFTELVAYTPQELRDGNHHMRENMVRYLDTQALETPENVIGDNPVDYISLIKKDLIDDTAGYFEPAAFMLQAEYMWSPLKDPEGMLQNIINIPHRSARRTIATLQARQILPHTVMPNMRKSVISAAAHEVYAHDERLIELYDDVHGSLHNYLKFLGRVAQGDITREEYDQVISATIVEDAPKAVELLHRMKNAFLDIVNGHHTITEVDTKTKSFG